MDFKYIGNVRLGPHGCGSTLVGYSGPFPRRRGNCLTTTYMGRGVKVLNMHAENMEHLYMTRPEMQDGISMRLYEAATTPPTLVGMVYDPRISDDWLQAELCSTCCPGDFPCSMYLRDGAALVQSVRTIAQHLQDDLNRDHVVTHGIC